jgi:hypothetical protein
LTLAPHQSVTLRYAYGVAHAEQIATLLDKYRAATDPLAASEAAWAKFVPQASFGTGERTRWLSRELQWDAYMVRSGATYEDCAGHHIISQGGYYRLPALPPGDLRRSRLVADARGRRVRARDA